MFEAAATLRSILHPLKVGTGMHRATPIRLIFAFAFAGASGLLAAPAGTTSPRDLTDSGFEHFYNLEYDQAIADFRQVVQQQPDSAEAWNHLSQGLFYAALFDGGLMGSDLIKSNDALLKTPKLVVAPARESEFLASLQKAMTLSEARLKTSPKDSEAAYQLGVSYALQANYSFLVKHSWLAGLKQANMSRTLHEQVLRSDPRNIDANLIPGTHEYMIGTLPAIVRLVARAAGLNGNRTKGLETVEKVAAKGERTRVDAQILVCVLYRRENRSRDGIPVMLRLREEYPRNFLYRIELAKFYTDLGRRDDARAELRKLQELMDKQAPGYSGSRVPVIHRAASGIEKLLVDAPASPVAAITHPN